MHVEGSPEPLQPFLIYGTGIRIPANPLKIKPRPVSNIRWNGPDGIMLLPAPPAAGRFFPESGVDAGGGLPIASAGMLEDTTIAPNLRAHPLTLPARTSPLLGKLRFSPKSFMGTVVSLALYFGAAVCCLIQWGGENPWARFDIFSVGFLVITIIWCAATMHFHRASFRSKDVIQEAAGVTYDRLMMFWIDVFAVAELSAYLDYAHWRLVPQLEQPVVQAIGLVLYALIAAWLIWTDAHLSRVFRGNLSERKVIRNGPYRYVRHPRYTAMIAAGVAFAMTLGSVLAWGLAVGWIAVNLYRVRLEEAHLHKLFGADYTAYAARTGRFFPKFGGRSL